MIITLWNSWKRQNQYLVYFKVARLLGCGNVKDVYWTGSAIKEHFGIKEV